MDTVEHCRICKADTNLKWPSNLKEELSSDSFAITDAHYGQTGSIYQCSRCGFRQCSEWSEVLSYYEALEDREYEKGRQERYLQAEALIQALSQLGAQGRLLDVGAGSGILVEAARKAGFAAEGVEPSGWLQQQAEARALPVRKGVLQDIPPAERYDVMTLVDVLEHVVDPLELLKDIKRSRLRPGGRAMIVTPDCGSLFAQLLGRKWWHYRVAHIGYFNRSTLELACEKSGLQVVARQRPAWFFTLDYLWVRLMQYFPSWMRCKPMNWMKRKRIRLNLRDSLCVVVTPKDVELNG